MSEYGDRNCFLALIIFSILLMLIAGVCNSRRDYKRNIEKSQSYSAGKQIRVSHKYSDIYLNNGWKIVSSDRFGCYVERVK